jgi:hypothetical protein
MIDRDMLEAIGALDSGVLLPTCNIDQELAKMSPDEARKVKRKWRKLMRKTHSKVAGTRPRNFGPRRQ